MKHDKEFILQCEFSELSECSQADFLQFRQLMGALSQRCILTTEALEAVMNHPDSHLYVARHQNRIVACATLCLFVSPTGRKASIEDVVVLPDFQGYGLGRALMDFLLVQASNHAPVTLQLTSRPSRIAANSLYQKLGFQRKETNFYTLKIDLEE